MTTRLAEELARFERLLAERFPTSLTGLNPGLDDRGIRRLSDAVAPYRVPADVESLYRWRNGGPAVFGGWRMKPLEEIEEWRSFGIDKLRYAPAWLPLFDDHGPGFVELAIGETPPEASVWWAYSHDVGVYRLFDSLSDLIATCSDLIDSGLFVGRPNLSVGFADFSTVQDPAAEPFRLARSPGCYRRADPPDGTLVGSFPDETWPESWLVSVGLPEQVRRLRGATHTIGAVISAAATTRVEATVAGRALSRFGSSEWSIIGLTDGTGELALRTDAQTTGVAMARMLEVDVIVEQGARAREDEDSLLPNGVPAYAVAVREIAD